MTPNLTLTLTLYIWSTQGVDPTSHLAVCTFSRYLISFSLFLSHLQNEDKMRSYLAQGFFVYLMN